MKFSYWEQASWFSNVDFTVIGSGITGLNCAWELQKRFPRAHILMLERGLLPYGASTRNAGFACFGSLSEILDDLKNHSEEEVLELVRNRLAGLAFLRQNFGDETLGYREWGGYEIFREQDSEVFDQCVQEMHRVNHLLQPLFHKEVFSLRENNFGFSDVQERLIYNRYEGQLDTGKMMSSLLRAVQASGVKVLNGIQVKGYSDSFDQVEVETDHITFKTGKLLIATNGFAGDQGVSEVRPARAQVLITEPIPGLEIKGTFHLDKGYFYFRNVDNRILLGGGRNLDFIAEETTRMEETQRIQEYLEHLLQNTILPNTDFKIAQRWSGIMGVGSQKKPIIKQLSENVYCGVRLGGMGVAIGHLVGKKLADLL